MIVVTGGAGFIGSNLVHALNRLGHQDILVVDDLTEGRKFRNLLGANIVDYIDYEKFPELLAKNQFPEIEVIFHQGACSSTTEWDGRYMMRVNYDYSKMLFHYCEEHRIPFIYASSAAVYGGSTEFSENGDNEAPLNVYGYSKYLFDQYVRRYFPNMHTQVVGLRYFNVYGPREAHKEKMASVAYHLNCQLLETGKIKLFEGSEGYGNGEQRRDFIYVDDVVNINLWFWQHPQHSGIYNAGTGRSEAFNATAEAVLVWHGRGELMYIPFPEHLKGSYQSFTEADISYLRSVGYDAPFKTVAEGVKLYLDWLNK